METTFQPEQLTDPRLKEANDIIRRCVHCGLCMTSCPTYLLLGDERDSPRGRIYLIKNMLEGETTPRQIRPHLDRCLSCLSCVTACPSGVDYKHLSDYARQIAEKSALRDPRDEFMRKVLRNVLPHPKRFRLALLTGIAIRPFRKLLRRSRLQTLAAMLDLAPTSPLRRGSFTLPQTVKTRKARRGRVLLLGGCTQRVLRPEINDSTVRLLNHLGYDVTLAEGEGCCGSITLNMGKEADAKALARKNIDAWHAQREKGPLDAIIVNTSGCGTMVKDYSYLFAHDPIYADKARYVSVLAKDIVEFTAQQKIDSPLQWSDIRVAYHSPCSMEHGQRLHEAPLQLLRNAGFTVLEIPDGHMCCGAGHAYNILQPSLANELKDRKLASIRRLRPDCIATGNIGCLGQLSTEAVPIIHTVELLDWAYGGPCPEELKHLQMRVRSFRSGREEVEDVHATA